MVGIKDIGKFKYIERDINEGRSFCEVPETDREERRDRIRELRFRRRFQIWDL